MAYKYRNIPIKRMLLRQLLLKSLRDYVILTLLEQGEQEGLEDLRHGRLGRGQRCLRLRLRQGEGNHQNCLAIQGLLYIYAPIWALNCNFTPF